MTTKLTTIFVKITVPGVDTRLVSYLLLLSNLKDFSSTFLWLFWTNSG